MYGVSYTSASVTTTDGLYHYDSSHTLTADGLAVDGSFSATDERRSSSTYTLEHEYESEAWNYGSGNHDDYGNHLGYAYSYYVGPPPTSPGANTFSQSHSLVTENGAYGDVRLPDGSVVRLATGRAEGASRVERGASLYETEYSDTDPNQYHQFGVPNYGTSAGHLIRDWETRSRRVETTEEQFTLSYGPRSETRTGQSSVSSRFESVMSETRSEQSIDPTYGDGPVTEGERTIVQHLDKIFPFEGPPTGWEHHYEIGRQSNVDDYPNIGDIWHDRDPGAFTYEHVAPHDPLAEEELEDRAPVENTTPGGGGGSFILAPFRALATLLKPLVYAAAAQVGGGGQTRAFNLMRELNAEHGVYQRGAEAAAAIKQPLEATQELIVSSFPPTAQYQALTGHNIIRDQQMTPQQQGLEAVGVFGGTVAAIVSQAKWIQKLLFVDNAVNAAGDANALNKVDNAAGLGAPRTANPPGFSNPKLGIETHQGFKKALAEQTNTRASDWRFRVEPGQTGVDATYVGPKRTYPGFRHAELKPLTGSGFREFRRQLDNWQLAVGETALWFYNRAGIIGRAIGDNW